VAKGRSCVLNVEEEHERRRRLDDEYSAKLHRDRYDMCGRRGVRETDSSLVYLLGSESKQRPTWPTCRACTSCGP
jgi:hypothetical protein